MIKLKSALTFLMSSGFLLLQAQTGWSSLFNGKTLEGWKILAGSALFKVENGSIVGTSVAHSGNSFLVTEKEYSDFILELDVKIDDTSSNSGIQIRSHYDASGHQGHGLVYGCQVELDPSSRKWSGGIYDEGRRDWLYPVSLHAAAKDAFKVGRYNHIRVECIGNETRTWINEIPVACMIDTVDKSGFIGLQVHGVSDEHLTGKNIYFKNIRIETENLVPKKFPANIYVVDNIPNYLSDYELKSGWQLLFNGYSPEGWIGANKNTFPDKGWIVHDGLFTVLSSEGKEAANGGDIVTVKEYSAFDLSFDFRITPGANSGVKYFVTLQEKSSGSAIGLEYQILDDSLHPDAKLGVNGDRTLSSLYDLIPANKQRRFIHPVGQWNTGRIIVYPDNHVEHYLNGIKVLEYQRGSEAFRALVAVSKYKIWPHFGEAMKGHILLQDHGNEVSFRSIKIRVLK